MGGSGAADGDGATGIVAILDGSSSTTNPKLERAWRELGIDARLLTPAEALRLLREGDTALTRIDVRPSLDGVDAGLLDVLALIRRGVRVLNRPAALLAAHDKLRTARLLTAAGLPHPETLHLRSGDPLPRLAPPLVLKPRFGSWGADVFCCQTRRELERKLLELRDRGWFNRQGVLVQQLVPPCGHDLRLLVAAGRVVGAIRRRARKGDWRTNYSLGGTLEPVLPPAAACTLAVAAAGAAGADFVGVDLIPCAGGHTVIELNGAVDFKPAYALGGESVYGAIAAALLHPGSPSDDLTGPPWEAVKAVADKQFHRGLTPR